MKTTGNIDPAFRLFPRNLAEQVSDLAAVLLYDLARRTNGKKKPTIRDGKAWVYDAMEVFTKTHPYASESGVRKAFLKLKKADLIIIEKSRKYNRMKIDPTWWYHVTPKGMKAAKPPLICFLPDEAKAHGIPSAVLLEHIRFESKTKTSGDYVEVLPTKIKLPYSAKTIRRSLVALVNDGIIERNPADEHQFRFPQPTPTATNDAVTYSPFSAPTPELVPDADADVGFVTVPHSKLLPPLNIGQSGLLVAHSGTGKTSFSVFTALQMACSGLNVLYFSLEEPAKSILNRAYSSTFGISYPALHREDSAACEEVQKKFDADKSLQATLKKHFKLLDFQNHPLKPRSVASKIRELRSAGFSPDVVFIDQLEFIAVDDDDDRPKQVVAAEKLCACLKTCAVRTWVIHQVEGAPKLEILPREVCGGADVLTFFDAAIAIGKDDNSPSTLKLVSLHPNQKYDSAINADFEHMRFAPVLKSEGQK